MKAAADEGIRCLISFADEGMAFQNFNSGRPSEDAGKKRWMDGNVSVSGKGRVKRKKLDLG